RDRHEARRGAPRKRRRGDSEAAGRDQMRISLPKAVDEDLAADLEKQSVYVSPSVRGVRVNAARDAVEVDLVDDHDTEAKAKVARFIEAMVARFRKLPKKIFAENKRRDSGPLGRG